LAHPIPIVALDVPDAAAAYALLDRLGPSAGFVKVGLQLFTAEGPGIVRELRGRSLRIFLDLKLHDIPNTVARAVRSAAALEVELLTVHASGGASMLRAAAEAAAGTALTLLGVTVLTSLDRSDLEATGVNADPSDQVLRLAGLAHEAGLDGVICSPHEIAALRRQCGPDFVLMVPGIRPVGSAANDQKRAMTPRQAVSLGATNLVVGRPIYTAADPRAAAESIAREAGVNDL